MHGELHTMQSWQTHPFYSIHIGPCLDQHPARSHKAIFGSEMERRVLVLRGWVGDVLDERNKHILQRGGGKGGEMGGSGNHRLRMVAQWNSQENRHRAFRSNLRPRNLPLPEECPCENEGNTTRQMKQVLTSQDLAGSISSPAWLAITSRIRQHPDRCTWESHAIASNNTLTLCLASTWAPALISTRHAATWPLAVARWRGVYRVCTGGLVMCWTRETSIFCEMGGSGNHRLRMMAQWNSQENRHHAFMSKDISLLS